VRGPGAGPVGEDVRDLGLDVAVGDGVGVARAAVPEPLRPLTAGVLSLVAPPKVDWLRIVVPPALY